MLIDNVDDFATWLVDELKELCEADPYTLSKYVIALLKKDKSESNLKKICNEQLNVFLLEKTENFVENVFECLRLKKYMPKIKLENIQAVISCEAEVHKPIDAFIVSDNIISQNKMDDSKDNLSGDEFSDFRKISPRFRDLSDNEDDKKNISGRSYSKRPLNYSGHRSSDESRKKRRYNEDVDLRDRRRHSSRHRSHKSKRHVLDRLDHSHKHYDRNDDSKLIGFTNEQKQWNVKTSCPDFVEKGVCLKGDSCEFDHGTNIVRSDLNCIYAASGISQVNVNPNWSAMPINQAWVDYPVSKQNKNLVHLKNIDQSNDRNDYRNSSRNNNNSNSDIYDPSHPEIDAKGDTDSRNGSNEQVPVYVPTKVESNQRDGSWWQEVDELSNNNNSNNNTNCEGSQVTTVIGSGKNRSRRTVSPPKRGRFGNSGNNISNNNYNTSNNNYSNNNKYNNYNNNNNNNNYNNSYNHNNNNNINRNANNKQFNKRIANARCLLVTHIPVDCNDEVRLKQHFRAFGMITDVEVRFQNDPQHALIEFATVEEAKVAFRSPLPILDNRFIRTSLFARPDDSSNLKVCKDTDDNNDFRDRRQVVQCKSDTNEKDRGSGDEMAVDKWPQHSQSSDEERTIVVNDPPKPVDKKTDRWPVASELRLDRRSNPSTEVQSKDHSIPRDSLSKLPAHQREEKISRITEAQIERLKKMKEIADRKELDARIDRLEESVESCKNRLKNLLLEQKNPDCDKDLVKRQLIESYNYYKELRDMHESLKKKRGPRPEMTETDKLKLKIKNMQTQLTDVEKDSDSYKKQLRMITEMKRDLVKLQTITKGAKPNRLPSLVETKLDNRPKTLYITGACCNGTVDEVKRLVKKYQVEKVDRSDNDTPFFAIKFKTRNEADRMMSEMSKLLKEKGSNLSFEKPIQICDPLDFKTISDTQRGTPRDNCPSSDEEDGVDNSTQMN